jgi:hypothetical protein
MPAGADKGGRDAPLADGKRGRDLAHAARIAELTEHLIARRGRPRTRVRVE